MARQRPFQRTDRVNQQLLETLAGLLLTDVRDPSVSRVQLTAVEVTRDLSHAKVYFVPLHEGGEGGEEAAGLERAAGFLRSRLAKMLTMRRVPKLEFIFDESIGRGRRMESLLASTRPAREEE